MADTRRRDIIAPCEGQGHKVRLASGLRFFARARCPKCRAEVDPTRMRRLLRFATNLARPASDNPLDRVLWGLALATVILAALAAITFQLLADRWWAATLLLFGPRWVLLLPLPVLMIFAAIRDRALLVPLLASAWLVAGPIMGFHTGWRGLLTRADPARDLTVATFNIHSAETVGVGADIDLLMREWRADVAVFQECGFRLQQIISRMEGWEVWTGQSQCLLSRFPVLDTRVMPAEELWEVGGSGLVASHLLDGDEGRFWVTNVHLETPRAGLNLIRRGSVFQGIRVLRQDSYLRDIEHRRAQRFVAALEGPSIVMGDFNAPDESQIYREHWGRWTNAFSVAGFGTGGTRLNGWIRTRIDHVLVDDSWRVVDVAPARDVGSDHLPLVARLRRR